MWFIISNDYNNRRRKHQSWKGNKQSRSKYLMPPRSLTGFEIQKYYKKEPTLNGVNLK